MTLPKYKLNPLPEKIDQNLLDRLAALETATIGHFYHYGFVSADIVPVGPLPSVTIASTVATVALPGMDSTLLHHVMSELESGYFLAVDRLGDNKHACWGGGVSKMAHMVNLDGACIDGKHTDTAEIEELEFHLWSSGVSAITTRMYDYGGTFNYPVSIGGVAVLPGSAVLADASGIVFIPKEDLEGVIEQAEEMTRNVNANESKILEGLPLRELSGAKTLVEQSS